METETDNTEFICNVVRVKEVVPHPNADRLDIVRVENFLGDIVCSRGEWEVGNLAVHVGPDSMVPLDNPSFSFLKTRLDVKPGESHYRIRMAKIRGVPSHGILVKLPEKVSSLHEGDELADMLGVLKYETPAERRLRQLDARDNSANPVSKSRFAMYLSRFVRWLGFKDKATSEVKRKVPDYSLVPLRKAPGYFIDGEQVEVTEKIHGSNIRFGLYRGKPLIASHHVIKSDHRPWWKRWGDSWRGKNKSKQSGYYKSDIWTDWVRANINFDNLPDNTIFYGEIYGEGIQELTYGETTHKVRVFDILDVEKQEWFPLINKLILLENLGIKHVPLLACTPYDPEILSMVDGTSTLASHIREGIVIKSLDGKKRGKLVSDEYKMKVK